MAVVRFLAIVATVAACRVGDTTRPPASDRRPPDPDRLLADSELVTPIDVNAAPVPSAWVTWMGAHAIPIRSLTSNTFDDLQFLRSVIGNRRVVQLGESGHGVREFNTVKVRLIKFLHEELGFNVIAFESGLHECWAADLKAATSSADATMDNCIFGVWHTNEVIELFSYLQATRATARPLRLAGFDVQVSSIADSSGIALLADVVARTDETYAARAAELERAFQGEYRRLLRDVMGKVTAQVWLDSVRAAFVRGSFLAAYDSLTTFIDQSTASTAGVSIDGVRRAVARQLAFSRATYIRQTLTMSGTERFEIRDRGMADQIDVLADVIYPSEKIIVWAHNAHIQHAREAMRALTSAGSFARSMGTWISQRRRPELYTIGFFMYTGTAADNGRKIYPVTRPLANSLEAALYQARRKWIFVDMLSQQRAAGTEWMYSTITAKEWGTIDYRMIMRDQFDGIVFVHTVSPPSYR